MSKLTIPKNLVGGSLISGITSGWTSMTMLLTGTIVFLVSIALAVANAKVTIRVFSQATIPAIIFALFVIVLIVTEAVAFGPRLCAVINSWI